MSSIFRGTRFEWLEKPYAVLFRSGSAVVCQEIETVGKENRTQSFSGELVNQLVEEDRVVSLDFANLWLGAINDLDMRGIF